MDLKQVWFAGVHSDVGGGYPLDRWRRRLSDIPMIWMKEQAEAKGLEFRPHFDRLRLDPVAEQHEEANWLFKLLGAKPREFPERRKTIFHASVKERHRKMRKYRPKNLVRHLRAHGWGTLEK